MTMKPIYDQAVRAEIRNRMSPPNRQSVAEIARDTGITTQTLYRAPRKIAIFIDLTKGNKKTLQWESPYMPTFVYSWLHAALMF